MRNMRILIDIAVVFQLNLAIFQWKKDVHFFPNKTNFIKNDIALLHPIFKFARDKEAGILEFDIAFIIESKYGLCSVN